MKIGSTIVYKKPHKDRRPGDPLVIGMKGVVRRVIPASETSEAERGDRIEATFMSGYGCAFGAWVESPEVEVIAHG